MQHVNTRRLRQILKTIEGTKFSLATFFFFAPMDKPRMQAQDAIITFNCQFTALNFSKTIQGCSHSNNLSGQIGFFLHP